ncbi:Clp protease ClpP [Streptomyces sp. NBC_01511]|uniref:head maturation protease, ClpP-related n=1 Tax=Streptomyces sp. NBC_01511 TaxID=2903889 RepID=UPI00386C86AA
MSIHLGPLPRPRTFNSTTLTAGAQRAFLAAGARDERTGKVTAGARPTAAPKAETWYRLENQAGAEPTLHLYGEIGAWGITASDLIEELKYVTSPQLTVHLSSPGGEIFEGIAVYNALRSHPSSVTVRVDSLAASIASVILQAGDRRVMQPFSQVMIHEGSGLCWGDAADMLEMAELLDRQSDNIAAVYAERGGGTPESWRDLMRAESWFTAEEAVTAGLADEVDAPAEPKPDKDEPAAPAPAALWDLSAYKHAGRAAAPVPLLNSTPEPPPVVPEPEPEPPVEPELPPGVEPGVGNPGDDPEGPPTEGPPPVEGAVTEGAWAALTAQLTTVPTWDDMTASLREASK